MFGLCFFAFLLRASQMDRNLSFQRCALHDGVVVWGGFSCNAALVQDGWTKPLLLPSLWRNRPFSNKRSCFALSGNEWVKWFLSWNDGRVSCLRGCNGYCEGLMIVSFYSRGECLRLGIRAGSRFLSFLREYDACMYLDFYSWWWNENRKGIFYDKRWKLLKWFCCFAKK